MNFAAFLGNIENDLSVRRIAANIILSAVIGFVIFASYLISHRGTVYSKKFNSSLVALTTITGTVMTVIGSNLALSLGMVGALSIVRFRTAVKDSRDTVYIFWSITAGICCGVGDYAVAGIGSAVIFAVFTILNCVHSSGRMLLTVRAGRGADGDIQTLVFECFGSRARLRLREATEIGVEYIFEISESLVTKAKKNGRDILTELLNTDGVTAAALTSQSEDISE